MTTKKDGVVILSSLKNTWQPKLLDKNFRTRFLSSFFFLAVILFFFTRFLHLNEKQPGFSFSDPLLSLFHPVDVTWLTFGLIYTALIIALVGLSFHPGNFIIAIQSYALLVIVRFMTLYLLPLNPPASTIPLVDPFVQLFGGGQTLCRDLFFSGHTSIMFLFFLTSKTKNLKIIFLIATVLVGASVLIQHVHYTIDVLAAPFFAYSCYRAAIMINNRS